MDQLHIFFLPFLSPGNMIPMVDMAKLFASRGVRATIVTTAGNLARIKPAIDRCPHPIQTLAIPFPSSVPDNMSDAPAPDLHNEVLEATCSLEAPFDRLLAEHRPDCVVSDICYTWSAALAAARGIPRLIFRGSSAFSGAVAAAIARSRTHEGLADDDEPFVVPGIPHRIEMSRSRLMCSDSVRRPVRGLLARMAEAGGRSYGTVLNTCYELEPGYVVRGEKIWALGPVSLCNKDALDKAARGGETEQELGSCLNWLNGREQGSVVYVCFGSMGGFGCDQLREMAAGLAASGHPFLLVVRSAGDTSEWMPKGFEEGKGMIVRGWAPQVAILNHRAVGGFVTHCGWNSCLEGASCGVPMVTWPLASDQFSNERLVVDVLRIGVAVGSKKFGWREEERTLVSAGEVSKAVREVMGSGEEAEGRRKRARETAEKARKAMEEGGSSYNDMSSLIRELADIKSNKAREGLVLE